MSEQIQSSHRHSQVKSSIIDYSEYSEETTTKVQIRRGAGERMKTEMSESMAEKVEPMNFSRVKDTKTISNCSGEKGSMRSYEGEGSRIREGLFNTDRKSSKQISLYSLNQEQEKRLKDRISELQVKLGLERQMNQKERNYQINLNQAIISLGTINQKLQKENKEKDEEIRRLKDLLNKCEKGEKVDPASHNLLERYKKDNESLEARKKQLEVQMSRLKGQKEGQAEQNKKLEQRVTSLRMQVQRLQKESSELQRQSRQIEQLKQKIDEQQRIQKIIKGQVERYRQENITLSLSNNQNGISLELIKKELKDNKQRLAKLEEVNYKQKLEIQRIQKQLKENQAKSIRTELQRKKTEQQLKRQINQKDKEFLKLTQKDEQAKISKLQNQNIDKKLSEALAQNKQLKETIASNTKKSETLLQKERKSMKNSKEVLTKKIIALKGELQLLRSEVHKTLSANANILKTLVSSNITNGFKNIVEKEVAKRVKQVEQKEKGERVGLQAQINKSTQQKEQLSIQLQKSNKKILQYRKQIEQKEQKINLLTQNYNKLLNTNKVELQVVAPVPLLPQKCHSSCSLGRRLEYFKILFAVLFFEAVTLSVSINLLR